MKDNYTKNAKKVLELAGQAAKESLQNYIGTEHLLMGLIREPDGVEKVAQLVKFFVDRGGHQLQINSINRETLVDAQAHPERHAHLIVRVWGWSGYFIELDKPFQDQIIKRVELAV